MKGVIERCDYLDYMEEHSVKLLMYSYELFICLILQYFTLKGFLVFNNNFNFLLVPLWLWYSPGDLLHIIFQNISSILSFWTLTLSCCLEEEQKLLFPEEKGRNVVEGQSYLN